MKVKASKTKKKISKKIITKKENDFLLNSTFIKQDEESNALFEEKNLELNLNIDKKEYLKSDIGKIEIMIAEEPMSIALKKIPFHKNMSKKNTNMRKTNLSIKHVNRLRKHRIKEKNKTMKKISEISPEKVIDISKSSIKKIEKLSDEKLFGTSKKLVPVLVKNKNLSNKRKLIQIHQKFPQNSEASIENASQTLRKEIRTIKRKKEDLASLIQKDISKSMPQNLLQRRKGTIDSGNKNTSSTNNILTKKIKNILENKTNSFKFKKSNYVIEKKRIINKNVSIKKSIKLSNNFLKKYSKGKNINLIYQIKDKKGKVIQNISSKIDIKKEKIDNNSIPNLNYEIVSFRKNRRMYMKISNTGKETSYYNVYYKKHHELFNESLDSFQLAQKKITLRGKSSITLEYKNHAGPVTFRVLEVTNTNIEYSNFLSSNVSSLYKNNLNVYAGMTTKLNYNAIERNISVFVNGMPNIQEYKGVQLLKRNLSKKEKNYTPIHNISDNNMTTATPVPASSKLSLIDYDVKNNQVYEYKLLLYDSNKNKLLASSSCIEEYEVKTDTVAINFIQEPVINENVLTITLSTTVTKKDADRLFEDLFGNLYNLFEDDLKGIKDVNALSIQLEVEMFNKMTGEMINVGKFSVAQDGRTRIAVILPDDYDYYQSYCLKIKPKVSPPAEILTKISTMLSSLGARDNFKPISSFSTPAIKKKLKTKESEIISFTGNKFTSRQARTKGRIEDDKKYLERTNLDFYFDGSTGDQIYFDIPGLTVEDSLLTKFLIKKINNKNAKNKYNKNQNIENDVKIKVSALYNFNEKNNIDFFIASYEENGVLKNEGLAFIENNNFNFLYDIKCPVGEVNFLFIPVFNDGTIGNKIPAGTKFFNSDGVMNNG
jgi:hypothetical protein